jgi:hypothetical protein
LKRSKARTFRVETDIDEAMEKIAKEERLSNSQVMNKALRKYVEWDRALSNRGLVSVPSLLLVKLMAEQSEEKAREMGRWAGRELFLPNLLAEYSTVSVESADRLMKNLGAYGGRFTFEHTVKERKHIIVVGQKMGRNWSVYYAGALEAIFVRLLGKVRRETVSENLCVIEFESLVAGSK